MDEYPSGSLDPSIPLLVTLGVSGVSTHGKELSAALRDQAVLVRSAAAALDSEQAIGLRRFIQDHDASKLPWTGREPPSGTRYRFRVRSAERLMLLPPRRATLPDGIDPPSSPAVLHSPFSPLSPISPLYPDGLIDTQWLQKHQVLVPCVLLCFYTLVSDPTQATLRDNQIKTDISNIRAVLNQSGYKTRIAVVLLADQSASSIEGAQERLETIRKGCGIDAKCLFLVPPNESPEELERMAENMLATLYPVAIEYYRDLGRHARKKRSRGVAPQPTIPPTSGTSQTLSLAGWNFRYDFKSAVFAEFRVESDNALRSYDQAYEGLLSSELLEVIPSWSPRWNEARFLADVIAVRSISCLLWGDQHSRAVRRWRAHRDRMAELIDRRGRGTNNYGWKAWEARWALVMANLVDRADITDLAPSTHTLFLPPEKSTMGERLQPWELLHHTGYWYRLAAKHLHSRRAFARAIPDDDRKPPSSSPASHVASKAFTYDTYMCPEPYEEYPLDGDGGVDHGSIIISCLIRARSEFLKRQQVRLGAELSLECARELAMANDWQSIVELLRPLWKDMPFRAEGWLQIMEELSWILRGAAAMVGEASLVVAIDWELLNRGFTKRANWPYDLSKSLDGISVKAKPQIHIDDGQTLSFVSTSFLFREEEGKAGQSVDGQLTIKSNAHPGSAPVTLSSVQIQFNGCLKRVSLDHADDVDSAVQKHGAVVFSAVTLEPTSNASDDPDEEGEVITLQGVTNLTLVPGQTIVIGLQIPLRQPGTTKAESLTLDVKSDAFDLDQYQSFQPGSGANLWYLSASRTRRVTRANPLAIGVLPRPPQMEIVGLTWKEQYYTDEEIKLEFEVVNEEDVEAVAKLDVTLRGEEAPQFAVELPAKPGEATSVAATANESKLTGLSLGAIASSKSITALVSFAPISRSSQYDLTLKVVYYLSTNPGTPITQTTSFQLNIVNPFEANYDLLPRINPDAWPSVFDPDSVRDLAAEEEAGFSLPKGVSQTWCLVTRYASFASEDLRVLDVDVDVQTPASVRCRSTKKLVEPAKQEQGWLVKPRTIKEASFDIVAQKSSVDDRTPVTLDVSLVIKWTRLDDEKKSQGTNTTTLPVPRFVIFGTEPRVLASVSHVRLPPSKGNPRGELLLALSVMIENASNHFLTFGLTMEPSDEFAFSGAKKTTVHLLPVSRRSVTYRILPLPPRVPEGDDEGREGDEEGYWIKPGLVVRDKYFQKTLRVIPTEGMKVDKDGGFLVWVPRFSEEEE
ncbi:trafficking protein particle complex subunit 11 [Echria macrotheca]|uniref:Trafficking protein particle complex subunit 11 n=1 Tax=Echria macrotheca TaxID=438768 RepID=A0AAJ0BMN4_9PEZI|nr:trafficking protein particle complex subunit 11 [Echria macrotheca]